MHNTLRIPRKGRIGWRRTLAAFATALLAATASAVPPAFAQQTELVFTGYGSTRTVELGLNKSMIIDLPADVAEVIVSQPNVAGAVMRTMRRAIIQGTGSGDTNIFFLDAYGRTIGVADIKVIQEPSQVGAALQSAISRLIPGSAVVVESVALSGTNRVVLAGTVLSGDDYERAGQIATQFAGGGDNVANLITVAGGQQVMLEVIIAEVRRDVVRDLGINLSGSLSVGTANFNFNSPAYTYPGTNGFSGAGFGIGNVSINAQIQALETRGAMRVLAQPTLTAMSGQAASFLVGGEMAIPVVQDGTTTYEFKDYGVQLDFTPVIRSNGQIGLTLKTVVSEPQIGTFALNTRRAETSVEIPANATLAIGGLLDERVSQSIEQFPGLGDIPILGALFRSRGFQTMQTELVILVTPRLAQPDYRNAYTPSFVDGPLPTERTQIASDAETIFLGHLERTYGVGTGGGMRGSLSGSVGFVLD